MNDLPWEDNLLERKVESDLKDILKTLVAFANSVKPGHIAVILIGEKDDGTIVGVTDPDNIQKKVRNECEKIYPGIPWRSKVYEKSGKHCIRVEIEYSGETPHFGGPAWVRKGSETIKATDEVFQRLIDLRSGMVRELSNWIRKEVIIVGNGLWIPGQRKSFAIQHPWPEHGTAVTPIFVNNFWVTFKIISTTAEISEPLEKLTLTYDDDHSMLKVIVSNLKRG